MFDNFHEDHFDFQIDGHTVHGPHLPHESVLIFGVAKTFSTIGTAIGGPAGGVIGGLLGLVIVGGCLAEHFASHNSHS
ncbi:hypothetical protein ACE1CD_22200 [Aerosakkonema sp. BLCC-F183]|uniref:hypothetical protein n=1 Tax=Aerosakkonema sp. BLCC-F183 TaxID=3342834 RepID=UPI0035B705BE